VADAAEGVLLATEKYDSSEPVNLGSGWEISMKELATTIARLMNFKGEIRWDATKSDGIPRRMLNPTRAARAFGFNASTPFEEGLLATILWHKENFSRP
jgi:GDP-L-fucose synthase